MTFHDRMQLIPHRLWLTAAMFVLLAGAFGAYVNSERQLDAAGELRHRSFLLADQLRQSSDDLTRMARTYVATGDPRYKAYYQDILEIRDGQKPLPPGYLGAYWDLLLAHPDAPRPQGGHAVPLLELMREEGFPEDELRKLAEAKADSDRLTAIEFEAMKLVESAVPDGDRPRALRMLHDADYHRAKAAIMGPITEVYVSMDRRTTDQIDLAHRNSRLLRFVFIACVLGALLMLWRAYAALRKTLGGSAEQVHQHILGIGRGEFTTAIEIAPGMEDSVLAGLSAMQRKLQQNEEERKQADAELRASAESLNEAQRIAHVGSWTLDIVSSQLIWSDEIFRLFEIDPTQFGATYQAFLDAIHPEDRNAVSQAYADSLKTRMPYEISHRLRMSDGRIKWVLEKCLSEFDAAGNPLRSRGTVQDVTERKLAELALRQSEQRFSSAFNSSPIAASIATAEDGRFIEVNANYTRDYGWTRADLIGRTSVDVGLWPDEAARRPWAAAIRREGRLVDFETSWMHKNGELRTVSISAELTDLDGASCILAYVMDITERKIAEERIRELAFFDQLTGLPNRTLLLDRLRQSMTASARNGNHGALLFIDLDNFKTLNDTLGHDMGDMLLSQVAQRLAGSVREGDTVARLGGDEFVVVLGSLSANIDEAATQTEAVGGKILAALNGSYLLQDTEFRSSASIGATLFRGHQASVDDLMKQADLAMYKSKARGRNVLHFFDPDMETVVMERVSLEKDLRAALQQGQFALHYQAQVVGDGRVTGAEVLLRWQHPQRGAVSPAVFIPLAEETGLILTLGNWVLETACAQLALWTARPEMAHLTVAVNVSARQFHEADFVEQVLAIISGSGANPNRLKLELTESLLVDKVEDVIEKMFALKAKGVGFALDDFGTGYSSLSYLKRLPLDQLKIDQSFVRDVLIDPNDAAIARTIVALAQSLGLGVIAEGVETAAQKAFLATAGCHAYQGYFFSRPLPVEGFEEYAKGT